MHWRTALALGLSACIHTAPAAEDQAEESATIPLPQAPNPSLPPAPYALESITVTAQKTPQSLQEVPLSISAIDGETLRDAGIHEVGRLEERVANLEIDADAQAPVIGIRGISTDTDNVGFEPSVGLLLDDVPLARSEFISDGLFDLQRVEVLRGPQGSLFGKNTVTGVVGFFSNEPGLNARGQVDISSDSEGSQRIEFAQNLPLGEATALRLAGTAWNGVGDIDNTHLDRREGDFGQRAGRLKLRTLLGDDLTLRASIQMSTTRSDYGPNQLFDAPPAVLDYARNYDPQVEDDPRNQQTSLDLPGFVERNTQISRLILDQEAFFSLPDWRSTLILASADFEIDTLIDADVSPASIIITDFAVGHRQASLEWRLDSQFNSLFGRGDAVYLVLGVYGVESSMRSNLDALAGNDLIAFGATPAGLQALGLPLATNLPPLLAQLPVLPGIPLEDGLLRNYTQTSRSTALFGQAAWNFRPNWSAIAGLRFNFERKRAKFDVRSIGPGLIKLILNAEEFQETLSRSERDISPKLGVVYRSSEQMQLFATVAKAFKGGGYNAIANTRDDLAFEPEEALSFEAGLKATWFDGSLRTNLTAYRARVRNLQVVDLLENTLVVSNAASAELSGLEAEISWLPGQSGVRLDVVLGLSDAHYRDYKNAVPTAEQSSAGQEVQDLSGRPLPDAPRTSLLIEPSISTSLPFFASIQARLALSAAYRGDQFLATDLDPHSFQAGYWLLGSSLSIAQVDEHWALNFSAQNLASTHALDRAGDNAVYANTYEAEQIPGRRLQLSFSMRW